MAKQYIFKQKPTRKNFNSLKKFGFVEINGNRDFVKLNFKNYNKKESIKIHKKLLEFLQNQGFFLLKTHGINRAGDHKKSYLNETPFDAVLSPTSPNGDFSNEKEHNISLKDNSNELSQISSNGETSLNNNIKELKEQGK
jgi:hypothetical protein